MVILLINASVEETISGPTPGSPMQQLFSIFFFLLKVKKKLMISYD